MSIDKVITYIGSNWKKILITVIVIILLWKILDWSGVIAKLKAQFTKLPKAKTPDGADGSQAQYYDPDTNQLKAYDPRPDVIALRAAMSGAGTDEEAIWDVLDSKNDPQLAAIYNDFSALTGEDLFEWFADDLSGSDLQKALNYFNGLNF